MAVGNLLVQVRSANDIIPVPDARVRIRDEAGNVLYDLVTDESGDTQEVTLDTVDKSLSLDPNYTGTPYTSYTVDVTATGFNSLTI